MGSLPPLLIASTAIICLGALLHIVGLSTDSWISHDSDYHQGLWKYCFPSKCAKFDEVSDTLGAVRAMVILGMLCGLVGAAVAVLMFVFTLMDKAVNERFPLVCLAANVAAFVFIIIGVIVYAAKFNEDDNLSNAYDLGYSFGLCIVGAILHIIGGILAKLGGTSQPQ